VGSSPRQVWLVRHGETEWSRDGRHTSRTDLPLTERGEAQARSLGALLAGRAFSLVLTSPLRRARETCELAGYAALARTTPDLCEWDYGAFEGRTSAEIGAEFPGWSIFGGPVPGGETAAEVAARAARVVARCREAPGEAVLFAHGHILRVLAATWLGLPPESGRYFALGTGTLSVLAYEHEVSVISLWNRAPGEAPGP